MNRYQSKMTTLIKEESFPAQILSSDIPAKIQIVVYRQTIHTVDQLFHHSRWSSRIHIQTYHFKTLWKSGMDEEPDYQGHNHAIIME